MSREQLEFIKKYKLNKRVIFISRLLIIMMLLTVWELLSQFNIINSFIFSSPSKIIKCISKLYIDHNLFNNIFVTLCETLIAFFISMLISIILSIILYLFKNIYKLLDPFLTLFNSLPKVAFGPLIIVVCGANIKSVVVMGILISVIVSTIVITNGFYNTDKVRIKLLKSFGASNYQLLYYLVFPSNISTIISSFKLMISMSFIGVISGEFLVSKCGLGYLIIYGTQIFNMDIVLSGILLLGVLSYLIYIVISFIENKLCK